MPRPRPLALRGRDARGLGTRLQFQPITLSANNKGRVSVRGKYRLQLCEDWQRRTPVQWLVQGDIKQSVEKGKRMKEHVIEEIV